MKAYRQIESWPPKRKCSSVLCLTPHLASCWFLVLAGQLLSCPSRDNWVSLLAYGRSNDSWYLHTWELNQSRQLMFLIFLSIMSSWAQSWHSEEFSSLQIFSVKKNYVPTWSPKNSILFCAHQCARSINCN